MLDEVRAAVLNYFGPDELSQRAESDLQRWGSLALPALHELAQGRLGRTEGHAIACATTTIDTREAGTLLVDILVGDTEVDFEDALSRLSGNQVSNAAVTAALDDPRTHPRVLEILEQDSSWLHREYALEIVAERKWIDAVPRVRQLLTDPHRGVREAAAEALTLLTEERVEIERPQLETPLTALVPDLLAPPTPLKPKVHLFGSEPDSNSFRCGAWFDGRRGIVAGREDGAELLDADGARLASFVSEYWLHDPWVAHAPGRDPILIAGVGRFSPKYVTAFRPDGKEAWSHHPSRSGLAGTTLLYGDSGPIGIAAAYGGPDGVVCLDLDGNVSRQIDAPVVYGVDSHPALPGRLLVVGGAAVLFGANPTSQPVRMAVNAKHSYFGSGALFPDSDLAPAVIVTGSVGNDGTQMLFRCDAAGREAWRVTLPDSCVALHVIEPKESRPLIAVATKGGQVLLLDEQGTLLYQMQAQWTEVNGYRGRDVSGLTSGALEDGRFGLIVSVCTTPWLYLLNSAASEDR